MDQDLKLKEILEIEKENNKLLKKLWRNVKISRATKVLYWIIIISITLGAYYYIQPFIDKLLGVYSSFGDIGSTLQGFPDIEQISELLGR